MMRVGGCVCAKDHAITERRVKRKEETLRGTNDDTSRVTFEKRQGGKEGRHANMQSSRYLVCYSHWHWLRRIESDLSDAKRREKTGERVCVICLFLMCTLLSSLPPPPPPPVI